MFLAGASAAAAPQHCVRAEVILWGDGKHDDTVALNVWLRGGEAIWADTGKAVGPTIAGRKFRLSDAIYVTAGSGRVMRDFRLIWPERGEIVSGGTIASGNNPDKSPVSSGIKIVGGDSGEGVPFEAPAASETDPRASCAIS
jgi:hypothetical protein